MAGDLVELARYPSSTEAAMVRNHLETEGIRAELDGEAMASWFGYFGSAIGGVRLLVSEEDAQRAREILAKAASSDETEDSFFGDDELASDDGQDDESDEQEPELPEPLMRAWRASLLALLLIPPLPLLSLYSTWLLIRHGLLLEKEERPVNWRAGVAMLANVTVFGLVAWFVWMSNRPQPPPFTYIIRDGEKVEVQYDVQTKTINLVPGDVPRTKKED